MTRPAPEPEARDGVHAERVAPGAELFRVAGERYDRFMGRYARPLAAAFADFCDVRPGLRLLDVGCGPGALTGEAATRLGAGHVAAVDPSPPLVASCAQRHPGVDVRSGAAEDLPWPDDSFDVAASQLVFPMLNDPRRAVAQMRRVVRPGGLVAACVWDFAGGMQMLRAYWDAAARLDPDAPDPAKKRSFGDRGALVGLFTAGGLMEASESTLNVQVDYADFDDLWSGFLAGVGGPGAYCLALSPDRREALRWALFNVVGKPSGALRLSASATAARAQVPPA